MGLPAEKQSCHSWGLLLALALLTMPTVAQADDPGFLGKPGSAQREAEVHGHEEELLTRPGVTGAWGGHRKTLDDSGITLEGVYTGEFVRNFAGGTLNRKSFIYEDNLDLMLTLDTEKLRLWPGGTLFAYGLRNHGGDPSADLIGDLQTASNIEAPDHFSIQELWYEQNLADGAFSLLFGLHDMNSEFYVSNYGALFINSSFGIGPELSGNVPSSIFPKAGLSVRVHIRPIDAAYVQAAVFDGDPATRRLKASEGKMAIFEAGIEGERGSYKAGYWLHTADKTFNNQTFKNDYGVYLIADQEIMRLEDDTAIGAFIQWGWVPDVRNEITGYFGGGLHMHGLLPARDEDDLGIAVARADTHASAETALELTYRLVLTPWLAIQPSFQWILNPGGDATIKTAKVGLFRFETTL